MRGRLSVLLFCFSSAAILSGSVARAELKNWTMLVYLNGDNSLDGFGTVNLKQMETIGSTQQTNVVVQWASLANAKTERLLIKKSSDPSRVTSPVVQDLGKTDMGDWRTLVDFIEWGVRNYPAKHYFVDVWDHGSGWHSIESLRQKGSDFRTEPLLLHPLDISWDDNTGHSITTQELGQAMDEASKVIGRKIDIYASDACLMGMLEVASEMKNAVHYFAGSQEVEPGAGWPYDRWLKRWAEDPDAEPEEIASELSEEYARAYGVGGSQGQADATMAVYDLGQQESVERSIAAFRQSLMSLNAEGLKSVAAATEQTQAFSDNDYGDLKDFLDLLAQADIPSLRVSLIDLQANLDRYVVSNHVTGAFQGHAFGASIWLPKLRSDYSAYSDLYKTTAFDASTGWGLFLALLNPELKS